MRHTLLAVLAVGLVGCSEPVDDTANQMKTGNLDYPSGPFGYTKDQVIPNLKFSGKPKPSAVGSYDTMPLEQVTLADFYNKPNVKYVMLSGVAGWCYYCNTEQAQVPSMQDKYEAKGVKFLEALVEGYDHSKGTPANEDDLNYWGEDHKLGVSLAVDPNSQLAVYGDYAAFPVNIIIRTSDMKIVHQALGAEDFDKLLGPLLAQ